MQLNSFEMPAYIALACTCVYTCVSFSSLSSVFKNHVTRPTFRGLKLGGGGGGGGGRPPQFYHYEKGIVVHYCITVCI